MPKIDFPPNSVTAVLQKKVQTITAATDITALIPYDGSTPQSNEGTLIFTQALTPSSATSTIEMFVNAPAVAASGAGCTFGIAVFVDGTFLGGCWRASPAGSIGTQLIVNTSIVSGSTTQKTITVRAGTDGGTITIAPSIGWGTGSMPVLFTVQELTS